MFKTTLLSLAALLFTACANDRGISLRYYNDCREYYDLQGHYHKECDKNLIEYEEVKETFSDEKKQTAPKSNVW